MSGPSLASSEIEGISFISCMVLLTVLGMLNMHLEHYYFDVVRSISVALLLCYYTLLP